MGEDENKGSHRSLISVLGEDTLRDTIVPFVAHLETAVSVYEQDGSTSSRILAGNRYCDLLINAASSDGLSPCERSRRHAAVAAIGSGAVAELTCEGGMIIYACPIQAEGRVVGAIVGAVSEVPADEATIRKAATASGVDYATLRQAADRSVHKPQYLYDSSRMQLELLAGTLGKFYEHSLEHERAVMKIFQREEELDEKNEFLNSLLNSMAEGVFTTDITGAFTFVNPAITEFSGYTADDLKEMAPLAFIPEDQRPLVTQLMENRKKGAADSCEIDVIRKDGQRITVSLAAAPLRCCGDLIGRVGVISDITQSRQMEKDLTEQNRRLNLIQSLMAKGVTGLATGKVFETLANEVPQSLGYDFCSIFTLSGDGKRLDLVARSGPFDEDFDTLNRSGMHDLDFSPFRESPPGQAFLKQRQIFVRDATSYEGYDRVREVARELGVRSMVSTPFVFQGEPLGVMVIHTRETHEFSKTELEFLNTVAAQVSTIIGTGRAYRQLKLSRERYLELYNRAADWMYTLDEEGVVRECNQTMVQALGYPRSEITGRHIYDFEVPEDREKAKHAIKATAEDGIFSAERTFVDSSGRRIILELHARVRKGKDGGYRWLVTGRDITEKKASEYRMKLLAAAFENAHDMVVMSDVDGTIISVNEAAAGALGYSVDELTARHMNDIFSEKNGEELKREVVRATRAGGWEGQVWFDRRDGSTFPVHASTGRVENEHGETVALVGIHRDISVDMRMTQEILRRNRELAVLNAVAATAGQSLDLHSILQSCVTSVVDSMGYDAGIIFLLDEESQTLKINATENMPDFILEFIGDEKVGEGFAGIVAATSKPLFVDDLAAGPVKLPLPPGAEPVPSMAGIPIIAKEQLLGVMNVATLQPHQFNEQEQSLLTAVAGTIGVAIENARLFDDVTRSQRAWETTFSAMTNGISIHDRDFTIIRANRALASMVGMSVDELIGKKCYEVFHGASVPIPGCPHTLAVSTGDNASLVLDEPYLDRVLNISVDPLFDDSGQVIGGVHDVRDITEQERLRSHVSQSEKLRALGEMAGGVAHDFNNFLTVILGNSQMLLSSEQLDQASRESLETIQHAAVDASETVRRIQEFTRVRTTREFTTVDMNQVVANALDISRPRWRDEAEARGAKIEMDVELGNLLPVTGNQSELGEVLVNLLLNAADSMPAGGEIRITSQNTADGRVEVTVTDTGQGMEEATLERIFEPFFSTKGAHGSGLGLSLVYGIVNRHGGEVLVESCPGKGSTFAVRLPAATVADLVEQQEEPPETDAAPLRPGRVLVIDDEEMIRELLSDILEKMGQRVEAVASGSEGVRKFRAALAEGGAAVFDLVLTDLGMPEMSGWDVVEHIKEASPATPVALITGWGDQLDPERMKTSKVDLVMAKPFRVEEVRRLAAKALAGKK